MAKEGLFSDPEFANKLFALVLFGGLLLALVMQVIQPSGSGVEFIVPTSAGIVMFFNFVIIATAAFLVFNILTKFKGLEKKDVFVLIIAIVILYFVFVNLNPEGLNFASVRLMSTMGMI